MVDGPRVGRAACPEIGEAKALGPLHPVALDDGHRETGHTLAQLPGHARLKGVGQGHGGAISLRASIRSGDFVLLDQHGSTRCDGGRASRPSERPSTAQAPRPRPGERGSPAPQASDAGAGGSRAAGVNLLNWPHWEVRRLEEGEHT